VLFFCGIHGVFIESFHGLIAADQFPFTAMQDFHDVPTGFTFVDFQSFGHNDDPPFLKSLPLLPSENGFLHVDHLS
jgi:hypothetical protein